MPFLFLLAARMSKTYNPYSSSFRVHHGQEASAALDRGFPGKRGGLSVLGAETSNYCTHAPPCEPKSAAMPMNFTCWELSSHVIPLGEISAS